MKIYCVACNKYLGEIRDAKLRKGVKFLCVNCDTKRIASDMRPKQPDYMKSLFGGIFKNERTINRAG